MEDIHNSIPSYELKHDNEEVAFTIRFTRDMLATFGNQPDLPHRHNYFTVLWSHNLAGKHIVDYKEFDMQPNDVFFINPGMVHQVKHTPDADGTVILFTCNFLEQNGISENFIENLNLFSEISTSPPISIDEDSAIKMKEYVARIKEAFLTDDPFKNEKIGAYLKLFLIESNKFAHTSISDNTQAIQSGKVIVKKFKELLENHFTQWKKVSEYANELNISADYLNEVAKSTIGKNAKELIQQRIILEAKRLGLHTDYTTKEIAYRIGFEDPSHFSRFFKNCEGSSFTAFRNALITELAN